MQSFIGPAVAVTTGTVDTLVEAIERTGTPAWVNVLEALTALGAIGAIVVSVRSLSIARNAVSQSYDLSLIDQIRQLGRDFDERGYFIRFWFLDQLTRTREWTSVDVKDLPRHVGTPREERYTSLWNAALGRDIELERADFFSLYHHALRVVALADAFDSQLTFAANVNCILGPHYLGTLLNHRVVACKLLNRKCDLVYYPQYYGLTDPSYSQLVDCLLVDLIRNERSPSKQISYLSQWDGVNAHLDSLGVNALTVWTTEIRHERDSGCVVEPARPADAAPREVDSG